MEILNGTSSSNNKLKFKIEKNNQEKNEEFDSHLKNNIKPKNNKNEISEVAADSQNKVNTIESKKDSNELDNPNLLTLLAQINTYQTVRTGNIETIFEGGTQESTTTVNETQQKKTTMGMVSTQFGKNAWVPEMAQQVILLIKDQTKTISMTLNPPNLGPLQIVVEIDNKVINVQFSSITVEVQQALRNGLPVLQDMMNQAGLQLGKTEIGYGQPQRGNKDNSNKQEPSFSRSQNESNKFTNKATNSEPSQQRGLVNLHV